MTRTLHAIRHLFHWEDTMSTLPRYALVWMRVVTCVVGACLSAVAAAQAPAPGPVPLQREGATVKISEHVYVIPDFKVGMVPNVGIVVGSRATLVIDPGMGLKNGQVVLREAQKVSQGPDLYIVNTHFHPEHTTGEVAFPPSAKVIRAAAQQQDVDEMGMQFVDRFRQRSPAIADLLQDVTFRPPAEIFETEKVLDLGGVRVRLLRLGPGHTRGDTVAFVEGDGVLFSGDLAMKDLFPAFASPQSDSRTWLASLDQMTALHATTLVPAHYELTDSSAIDGYRRYLKALQARVAALKQQGTSAEDAVKLLGEEFKQQYPTWDQPGRIQAAVAAVYKELP
jgi:glyoxylase-like metal-dependent hydrolase (beta-lactamase superfamily II)